MTTPAVSLSPAQIAGLIDHAVLQPTQTDQQMRDDILAVRQYPIASICIKPYAVKLAAELLAGTPSVACTVIGFPHGSAAPAVKAAEAKLAFDDGAREVDMVVNIGKVLSGDWTFVRHDIRSVLDVALDRRGICKVIFETDLVTADDSKIRLCEICTELGVHYVKTSTGFSYVKQADGNLAARGATEHDVALMRRHSGGKVGVKASGGVRSLAEAMKYYALGARRIGTTSTLAIMRAAEGQTPATAGGTGGY